MKIILGWFSVFLVFTTLGCMAVLHDAVVSKQLTYPQVEASWAELQPGQGRVVIYFPRLPAAGFNPIGVGGFGIAQIWIDEVITTPITDQCFAFADLRAGSHLLEVPDRFFKKQQFSFEIIPGELLFIELQSTQFEVKPPKIVEASEARQKLASIHHEFPEPIPFDKQPRLSRLQKGGKEETAYPTMTSAKGGVWSRQGELSNLQEQMGPVDKADLPEQSSEQAFRELSENLRTYEKLQQAKVGEDDQKVAWTDLTKKYPQWTKDVSPGDTDAVRFRALQDGKKSRDCVAAIPKETTSTNLKRITLRTTPDSNYYENDLYKMIKDRNFFSKSYNPSGNFLNDFVDNADGTVTDKVTGLMWQKEGSSSELTFDAALEYVQGLNAKRFSGHLDWRLPTIEELCSLLEANQNKRGQYLDVVFAGTVFSCWSADNRPAAGTKIACVVFFGKGDVAWSRSSGSSDPGYHYVRAVRTLN